VIRVGVGSSLKVVQIGKPAVLEPSLSVPVPITIITHSLAYKAFRYESCPANLIQYRTLLCRALLNHGPIRSDAAFRVIDRHVGTPISQGVALR